MTDPVAFVDTHVHFWERPHQTLRWDWLEPGTTHPVFGDMRPLIELKTYSAEEFAADIAGCGVSKAVHVQAAIGTPDPVEESKWLQAMAEATGWPTAIIADVSLQDSDAQTTIERHLEYSRVRGVRDFGRGDYLVDPAFERGYAILNRYGLVYDLDVKWEDMADAASLARRHPGIQMVVEHAGFPTTRTAEYFHDWRTAMNRFRPLENVFVKISGLGMGDRAFGRDWTIDTLRPWVEASVETFGVERAFFGTNFPVDRMFSTYHDLIAAYRALVEGFTDGDRRALFHENAERVYRI